MGGPAVRSENCGGLSSRAAGRLGRAATPVFDAQAPGHRVEIHHPRHRAGHCPCKLISLEFDLRNLTEALILNSSLTRHDVTLSTAQIQTHPARCHFDLSIFAGRSE